MYNGGMKAFEKHPQFLVRQANPLNGGPPLSLLAQANVTPSELFFVRSHGNTPTVHLSDYRFEIAGKVKQHLSFSLDELQHRFPAKTLPATLQCAGNRREHMMAYRPIPNELAWGSEAISHAVWTGVPLRELLVAAGVVLEEGLHVEFVGLDETERLGQRFCFGGSIPLEKAFQAEVLLAYAMNDQPLAPVHGFPLRTIVPGYIGARSVKWLQRITVQPHPSENYFQSHAYRLFPPETTHQNVDWETGLMLGELSINSVICTPTEGETVPAGEVKICGYTMAGGDRQVARVELSIDNGETWMQAQLEGEARRWVWQLWHIRLSLRPGIYSLVVRAMDTAANVQPSDIRQIWNFKGYMNNAWDRVTIQVS